jgi:uncharacterized protein YggE
MRRAAPRGLLAAAMAGTALLAAPAVAQDPPRDLISVSGEATISVPPDQAHIDAGVTSNAKNAREATEVNNAAMGKVLLALKAAGIDDKDIQTFQLSLQPQYGQDRQSPPVITGYVASNRVTVRLRDISRVAGVIDMVVAAGANSIGGINFAVSNASKLLDDARGEAIADARRKAEIYAKAAGVALGAPVSISEAGSPAPVTFGFGRAAMPAMASAPVAQGEETLRVAVNISWTIKPAGP